MKSILFLSAIDFKEKSIQVIRKTPEAYVKDGWDVYYIVARDNSKYGNYFYEKEVKIEGLHLIRFLIPFTSLINNIKNSFLRVILNKIRYWIAILMLVQKGNRLLEEKKIDVIYGYEIHGVLAVNILKLMGKVKKTKIVSRFQGTFFYEYLKKKAFRKIALNLDHLLALYLPADLCIMTNDGTQGDKALAGIGSKCLANLRFWVNGVDDLKVEKKELESFIKEKELENKTLLLTISRLERWKRVDRVIKVVDFLVNRYNYKDFRLLIIGDGTEAENLKKLVRQLNLQSHISFEGSIKNEDVKKYLNISDVFFSTYESSNVGNPLLEAIRTNKIIFTLNNGDTARWITHRENGFIYEENSDFVDSMAKDFIELMHDNELKEKILTNIKDTELNALWTWENRFKAEVNEVRQLIG